jgi:hypothetical protein
MTQANLTAQPLGLGGATADSYNRLSINAPAMLFNNAGAGIEATFNKNAAGNDAAFAFKTGFSARALIGLLGNDDFSFKVSPNGSTFFDAIRIDRSSGRVELPEPLHMPSLPAAPDPPPAGKLAVYARDRAGAGWLDVQRPSGRFFPLQPHFGVNRIATWAPSTSTTVNTNGMPRTAVGTVATPTLATTNLSTSMRRWRVTSAATADAVAEERSAGWVCWRGNADGLGGWNYVNRLSLTTLQANGMGFFGLYGSTAALAITLTLAAAVNCIGIGFQRGTHANWQLVHNDATGAPTLTDLGASFPVNNLTNVLTLYIAAAPNGSDIGVRVVEEVSGAAVEFTITTDMPAATQLLSPRNYMNNGATAAAVAYDCSGDISHNAGGRALQASTQHAKQRLHNRLIFCHRLVIDKIERPPCKIGVDHAGLDDLYFDTCGGQFEMQRFRNAFDRKLCPMVKRAQWERHLTANRRDVDDGARLVRPHMRNDRLGHRQQAQHIGVELTTDAVHRERLQRPIGAVARIVQQHINLAEPFGARRNSLRNRCLIGYVQPRDQDPFERRQPGFLFRRTHRCDHVPALVVEQFCRNFADARRRAGDKNCLCHAGLR